MILRIIGSVCILVVCGGFGFMLSAKHLKEERTLRQLILILDNLENELLFRLSPLPVLCRHTAEESEGVLGNLFLIFAQELESQISPNVEKCMFVALSKIHDLPEKTRSVLVLLGRQLGKFALQGQLKGLETVRQACRRKLKELEENKENRIRGYKTLGLCAGAALVILFI